MVSGKKQTEQLGGYGNNSGGLNQVVVVEVMRSGENVDVFFKDRH